MIHSFSVAIVFTNSVPV